MSIKTYLPLTFAIDPDYKSDKFIKLRMRICHDGKNPNNSSFTLTGLMDKKDSLCNSPILAHIYNDENDVPTIGGHDFVIEENKFDNSTDKIVYLEQPVGVIPEHDNFEITEKDGVHYVNVDGYIWRGYSNYCEDIIKNSDEIKISMEVDVLSYSYDAHDNCYCITDFIYKGVTLLNSSYETGMKNARASIQEFSLNNTSFETIQQELTNEFSLNQTTKKGEIEMNLEDILKEYSVTKEELDFEITEDMDEAALRGKLDAFVSKKEETQTEDNKETDNTADEANNDSENTGDNTDTFQEIVDTEGELVDTEPEATTTAYKREISVNEKFREVYKKLDAEGIYAYVIDMYDTYFIYDEYDVGTYKQYMHVNDNGEVIFDGAPVRVYGRFLTEEELAVLDEMNANYSKLKKENEELSEYKLNSEAEKRATNLEKIFASFDKDLNDNAEYVNLKKVDTNKELSVEEIELRCYALLGMKTARFSGTKKESTGLVQLTADTRTDKEDAPYGGLFNKYN